MPRRVSLPGADELFRATGEGGEAPRPAPRPVEPEEAPPRLAPAPSPAPAAVTTALPTASRGRDRGPSGRERHEEKITVYCSAEELVALERARLMLRADHAVAVDRGRIVREAVAVVLADLEAKGDSSILVRRLAGR